MDRLDQDGKILKRWPTPALDQPRLETFFGKDGKFYWWERGQIWRYDREDDEIPDVFGELGDVPIFVITAY